jgi:membrane fusion protein (multidrug efflux system)
VETRTEAPPQTEARGTAPPPINDRPDEPPKKPARKRPPLAVIIIGAIVLIVAIIWGVQYLAYATSHETTDDARVDADTVTITSKISERVAQVLVDTNDRVHKGEILIRLDDRDERTKLDQALAVVRAQRAQAAASQQNVSLSSRARNPRKAPAALRRPARRSRTRRPRTKPRNRKRMRPVPPSLKRRHS